jgi:urea carboxylase-associated protein 2
MSEVLYEFTMPGASHWSLRVRRGLQMRITDLSGQGNVGALFYNPEQLTERYNAPDTLKCQHTFKLTRGHCLYSDMGRIFCSIVEDSAGWHESVCGNIRAEQVDARWGQRSYQEARNERFQNGHDSMLVELAKYGLSARDLAANLNFFARVEVADDGSMSYKPCGRRGASVELRFEMDSLVLLHSCPHPLSSAAEFPFTPIRIELFKSQPVREDDACMNSRPENRRGFENNRLYHLGL